MMKTVLTNSELIDELEGYSAQITALALQIDKLAKLRSEAKISDAIYAELYEDIGRKVDNAKRERNDLADAARIRMKEIVVEVGELKYRLERLEVRRMLDFITSEKYLAAKEELVKRVAESDEIQLLLGKLVSSTEEAFAKIDSCMPEAQRVDAQGAIYNVDEGAPEPQEVVVVEPMATEVARETMTRTEQVARETITMAPKPVQEEALRPVEGPKELDIEAMAQQEPLSDERICPRCQTGNPPDGVFCFACGTKLNSSEHSERKVGPTMQRKAERQVEVPVDVAPDVATEVTEVAPEFAPEVAIKPEAKRKRHEVAKYMPSNGLTVQKCPKCGMENLSLAAYCYECNTALSGKGGKADSKGSWLGRP